MKTHCYDPAYDNVHGPYLIEKMTIHCSHRKVDEFVVLDSV